MLKSIKSFFFKKDKFSNDVVIDKTEYVMAEDGVYVKAVRTISEPQNQVNSFFINTSEDEGSKQGSSLKRG